MSTIKSVSSSSPIQSAATHEVRMFIAYVIWLCIGAIVTTFLTIAVWRSNNATHAAVRADASARIEEAKTEAANANEKAQSAILKQKELEQQNLNLAIALEKEHQERLRLEHSLSGRSITDNQRAILSRSLRKAGRHGISIIKLGDDEAGKFADEIIGEFQKAGWGIELTFVGQMGPPVYGIVLEVPDNPVYAQTAEMVIESFKKAGIPYSVRRGGMMCLIVGLKPFPKIEPRE